jgi:hypothetical protein
VRAALAALGALVAALAVAAAFAPVSKATGECKGITACIRVPGPWVVVPPHSSAQYLLSCPGGKSVVGGLDSQATSREVRVEFEGRLGAPVQPGVTTTRNALFRAVSTSSRAEAFQPLLGCVPTQGGGGRSTVSARVTPVGPSLEFRSRILVVRPGQVSFAKVGCKPGEQLTGAWHATAFRVKKPPRLADATLIHVTGAIAGKRRQSVVTVSAPDVLSIDLHAVVQVGAECAP